MNNIALAIEIYAENHTAGLQQLVDAVRAEDEASIALALALLKSHIKTDGARCSNALVDQVQIIVSRLELRLDDTHGIAVALATQQATMMVAASSQHNEIMSCLGEIAAGKQVEQGMSEAE